MAVALRVPNAATTARAAKAEGREARRIGVIAETFAVRRERLRPRAARHRPEHLRAARRVASARLSPVATVAVAARVVEAVEIVPASRDVVTTDVARVASAEISADRRASRPVLM